MIRIVLCFLAAWSLASVSATAAEAKPVPSLGTVLHDLRDFLPEAEKTAGSADDPIPAFSVKPDGYWKGYKSFNVGGSGFLSRKEIKAVTVDLIKTLREHYPDQYAEIDSDGSDTITAAKLTAYNNSKH
jgi:hypothetical protein